MFKGRLRRELANGELKAYRGQLEYVVQGAAGPDVFLKGSPMIAWDVTTQADIEKHILRDSIRRAFDGYYLLIWDDPRRKPNKMLRALARSATK